MPEKKFLISFRRITSQYITMQNFTRLLAGSSQANGIIRAVKTEMSSFNHN